MKYQRILRLGDLGFNGMGIAVTRARVYIFSHNPAVAQRSEDIQLRDPFAAKTSASMKVASH